MEKAYAKVYGGYDKIESGLAGHAMRDLTGAPCEYFVRNSESEIDANECWKFVWKYYQLGYILAASSEVNQNVRKKESFKKNNLRESKSKITGESFPSIAMQCWTLRR